MINIIGTHQCALDKILSDFVFVPYTHAVDYYFRLATDSLLVSALSSLLTILFGARALVFLVKKNLLKNKKPTNYTETIFGHFRHILILYLSRSLLENREQSLIVAYARRIKIYP